jgi:hypothetical protein
MGTNLTNQNFIQEGIKSRLKSENASFRSVHNLLSSNLLTKNLKIKIYGNIISPAVLYGCQAYSLTMRKEHRLRVFENRVLRMIFGLKSDEVTREWRKLHKKGFYEMYSSPNIIL